MPYREAVARALDRTAQGAVATLWNDGLSAVPRGPPAPDRLHDTEGLRVDRRSRAVRARAKSTLQVLARQGGERGPHAYHGLWRLRGWLDRPQGGIGMR